MGFKKMAITAGHRGLKTGAGGYMDEGEAAIKLRDDLSKELRLCEIKVVNDENKAQLRNVIKMLNKELTSENYCIDIHFNAFNKKAHGTEAVIYNLENEKMKHFASDLTDTIACTLGIHDRGVLDTSRSQHSRLGMLVDTVCPTIILEICFCDNENDVKCFKENYKNLVAELANIIFIHVINIV